MNPRFLLIEGCDFMEHPVGGQLSTARQLVQVFGSDLALVGWSRPGEPVGEWISRNHASGPVSFFGFQAPQCTGKHPIIPRRVSVYLNLRRFYKRILSVGCRNALLMAPETLLATRSWNLHSTCFLFSGVNPVLSGRYKWSLPFSNLLERTYVQKTRSAEILLAAADRPSIQDFVNTHPRPLRGRAIHSWPTRVDLSLFAPTNKFAARLRCQLAEDAEIFVSVGRISFVKGWRLLLDAFSLFAPTHPNALLVFVGDGEDSELLQREIRSHHLDQQVCCTGFQEPESVVAYMNAADAILVGSSAEGWSVSMVEALACGRPMVSTPVSAAKEMICNRVNGIVVEDFSPVRYAAAMDTVLKLSVCADQTKSWASHYGIGTLRADLESVWPAIC